MRYRKLIFYLVLAVVFIYTNVKVARLAPLGGFSSGVTFLFFVGMLLPQFLYHSSYFFPQRLWFRGLVWGAAISMGVWSTFMLFSISFDLTNALFLGSSGGHWAGVVFLALSVVLAVLGLKQALSGPGIQSVDIPMPDTASGLDGLRIVQISDLHIGPTINKKYIKDVVTQVMGLKPDLIAVTGDLADGKVGALEDQVSPLRDLAAPLGVFYVTGNHEYYWGVQQWVDQARLMGLIPLINENRVVLFNGQKILIAGVTDTSGGAFLSSHQIDMAKASTTAEACVFKLLLAHRPEVCSQAERAGFDLQLSGHTHAGQFFPWKYIVKIFYQHLQGLKRYGRLWVYINAGTGYWGPPHRFQVPSEITLIRLIRAGVSN